jgi:hypothetical protein
MKTNTRTSLFSTLAAILAVFYTLVASSMAVVPDLTNGGVQGSDNRTFNLGATGMRGWAYYVHPANTSESRQIQVSHVESGSPANGVLAVDDVILGADGTGATPLNFSSDARKSLAYAIQDAEARTPATLKLLRWRSGSTSTVTLTLQTMGAYTATAPYSCPKSALILDQGLQYVYNNESVGNYSFGGLTLLTTGDAAHLAKAQTEARALIPSASYRDYLMRDELDTSGGLPVWDRGHKLIFLAEYYLATGDAQVLPAIEAYAINIANNRSMFGTFGHGFADWKHGAIGGGYGTVSSAGLPCMLGLVLAKECGLTNPELDPAIEAANTFFAWYKGKGAIPYGDHEPYMAYESNGKNGLGAIYFGLQGNHAEEGKFFAQMATASHGEREWGHTGAFFNYLWAPLGAAQGGEEAAAEHFSRISWMLDLNRCWDGRFVYDCINGEGPTSSPNSDTYNSFKMSTAALLTYALPHRKLRITGKDQVVNLLTSTDVTEAVQAKDYDANSRNNGQLISDLSNWSPLVRLQAAEKLGTNGVSGAELSQITDLANNTAGNTASGTRAGACLALGQIGNSSSAGVLVALLTDSDNYVRFSAAEGMRHLPTSANLAHLNTLLSAAASTATPLDPLSEDPMQFAHGRLSMLLFYGGGVFGPAGIISGDGIDGVDRNLLYPAIRAVAETAHGSARSSLYNTYQNLDYADVLALSESIVDSIIERAPSDRMFNHAIRAGGVSILRQHNIAEGVPAGMIYAADTTWNGANVIEAYSALGAYGGSVTTVTPDPETVAFLESYVDDVQVGETVQGILAAIAADTNPTPVVAFKSIDSATADDFILTLPASSTTLRVTGFDHMQGDSIYTWNQIAGPGVVTFTPNGTSATASAVQFDGTPGTYQFEVTMSDSRGFTEVYETVTVFVITNGEVDDDPPIPNTASFAVQPAADSETAVSMTAATGSDVTGPVQYLFSETTGNPGATSSGWQTSPTYTDSGLSSLTQYAYTVTMRDSLGNTGATSGALSVTTDGTPPASDVISVNFYAYGGMSSSDYSAVTIEANESAGYGGWNTGDWYNYSLPWGLSSPASPVAIASALGSTATLTLNDLRNGGPYAWSAPHSLLPGDGNGDLMDGHCNATEDPGDESQKFDMTVSNITFGTYDVIVYIGGNRDQYGDGTAKYVFNGGAEQDFTLLSGEFYAFSEITNSSTPGNYLVFENVTGSSFTLKMWGNGFNHIGPTGFQIASAGTTSDIEPPTPDPASFAAAPYANGTDAISMTATAGSDASGPVEYLFSCLTPGGHGSGWQTNPSYTDSGLNPGTQYTYTITMRDASGNTGNASSSASGTTLAGPDTTAPNPDPMTWAVAPTAGAGVLVVHEDFDYNSGADLTGNGGTGFNGAWVTNRNGGNAGYFEINSTGLTFTDGSANTLPVSGRSAHRVDGDGRSEANRALSVNARSDLFGNGTTMWFSVLYTKTDSLENAGFVIGTDTFTPLTGSGGGTLNAYASGGEGFGFGSSGDLLITALGYDDNPAGLTEVDSTVSITGVKLIAGKIVWNANGSNDTLTLYNVTDLTSEPTTAIATVSADLDQSAFDQVALLSNNDTAVYDEIRLGTSFASVVGSSGGGSSGDDTITMTATTATDVSGVEYYFTETSGNPGGNDSGWQDSPTYTDTGLTSGTQYTYTVKARDKSGNQNETSASADASATTTGTPPGSDTDPPTPDPASFASAPAAISSSAIGMTATAGSDASGPVEYLFTETSGNPGGSDSSWQISPVYNDSGLDPDTQYTYTVTMRDSVGNTGTASAPASATTPSGDPLDVISLNFYAYASLGSADYHKVTLESGETAGVGSYNTNGWENFEAPFGLSSPMAPVTVTSTQGATATMTLNDVRNGWTYTGGAHSNLPGDGNGDLMDGHGNGTEDPYDESALFDMVVSDITYEVYDLIVYLGSNAAQFGDGTGKIVLNGGVEQDFTLPSGTFTAFAEITDGTTPGNYIVFTGLRDASLSLKVWGNGFNHIGPTGFQIVKDTSGLIPPGPASSPAPTDGVVGLPSNTDLSWTAGVDADSSDVYFGTDSTPDASEFQGNQAGTTFDPGTLANGTYFWRIDEVNADGTTTGPVWSFAVGPPAKAFRPMPWDGMTAVSTGVGLLSWVEGESASTVTHDVYFGTDSTPDAGEFQGNQAGTTFAPGALSAGTTYYWRVDQVNAQGTTTGDVWSFTTPTNSANKVKIFILCGQSNMEGHGEMDPIGTQGTLEYMYNSDPVTYAHLKDGGSWAVRDDAWISYNRGGTSLVNGWLTAGYGASSTTIGPELQFGHAMSDYYGEKVLLIKTAWGGKSLRTDFRPPSSGWSKDAPITAGDEGFYYGEMLDAVVEAMANISTNFPTYNPADGYEIAGYGWHQGWNDFVSPAFSAEYEANMANFIKDVRSSLGVPNLPFVIATSGMDGNPSYSEVELAQLAMENFATYPEFNGNVAVTDTLNFFYDVASSPADQGFHWNRNAKSYYQIGESMAAEMTTLLTTGPGPDTDPPTPNAATFAIAPSADSDTAISMTATTGSDPSGPVEYLFTETSGNPGATNSSWQASPSYTDSGLNASTQYTYTVTMRDSLGNEGSASAGASATTFASAPLVIPEFDVAPTPHTSNGSLIMSAKTFDPSVVDYVFIDNDNPGSPQTSGWQSSPEYIATGLTPGQTYSWRIRTRDAQGTWSPADSVVMSGVPVTSDTTLPTVSTWENNVGDGPIGEGDVLSFTCTVTFSENLETSLTTADFVVLGTGGASGTVTTVTKTSNGVDPAVYEVVVAPSGSGTIQLQIPGTAVIEDPATNPLAVPVSDPTIITINASTPPYASWQTVNGTAQTLDLDHDLDGVSNGVEYFIGGPNGNTTGFTPTPGVTDTAGALSVIWTHAADYPGVYGTDFVVETSTTLDGAPWTTEALGGNVTITGDDVKYTFPAGTKNFARLKVGLSP